MQTHKKTEYETSLVVQWLRLCPYTAAGMGLIPDQGPEIRVLSGMNEQMCK